MSSQNARLKIIKLFLNHDQFILFRRIELHRTMIYCQSGINIIRFCWITSHVISGWTIWTRIATFVYISHYVVELSVIYTNTIILFRKCSRLSSKNIWLKSFRTAYIHIHFKGQFWRFILRLVSTINHSEWTQLVNKFYK